MMSSASQQPAVDEDASSATLTLPMSPDALFTSIHAYTQSASTSTPLFLASIGGLPTLFQLATLVTDPLTSRIVLSALSRALSASAPLSGDVVPWVVAGLGEGVREEVRLFVLDEVKKHLAELEPAVRDGPLREPLLGLLVGKPQGKADEHEAEEREESTRRMIAPTTTLLLAFAVRSTDNRRSLFAPTTVSSLLAAAGLSASAAVASASRADHTRLLRVLSFYIDLACQDAESHGLFLSSPLPPLLLDLLRAFASDALSQLNVVELLVRFVRHSPVFPPALASQLLQALLEAESTARPAFLTVATLQVVEALSDGGRTGGDWWRGERFNTVLAAGLDDVDESVQLQATVTLCAIAAMTLDTLALFMPLCLKHLPPLVTSSSELLQLAALHGLTQLFASSPSPSSSAPAVLSLKEELFAAIGAYHRKTTLAVLQSVLHTPFHSQRMAVFALLTAVSSMESAVTLSVMVSPGWLEWLLDRKTEHELDGLRAKYAVLDAIAKNSRATELSDESMRLVREYIRQGPVYVARESAVMQPLTRGG